MKTNDKQEFWVVEIYIPKHDDWFPVDGNVRKEDAEDCERTVKKNYASQKFRLERYVREKR